VTTIFGLLPLWLLSTPMWPPMAIAIIFGLLVGTVLTLGVAPCLYAIFFRVKYPRGWRFEGTGAKS
jgi:multidrug efflux pump subunit AcrB